ncbi:type II toxin-antitoxin system antitoxin DNA ADP-ribosyl glycohydrolase DarG [Thermus thermamylovorans]|uniref:type II toxin-antitoxin system antitoxin DNA ADP-ribosyl glycohydrolase DarG n=1 Tax=Thermus thermamylovorans TaxID=2509362 RepID=UPI001F387BD5|nr:macro domain-containing protein [Thermus thermamylovorans]
MQGDLLKADVEALVNTVNTVGVMGKGVALQFKRAFPENYRAYAAACRRGEVQIGRVFVHDRGPLFRPRYILNFPTKRHWRQPSRLEYVEAGLRDLVRVVRELGIRSLALPPLGAGSGGLPWPAVRERIQAALEGLEGVEVLVFAPSPQGVTRFLSPTGKKPRLTPARAALLKLFGLYDALGETLGRLEAQKLAYFLQEAGLDLRLAFAANRYGPYAEALNHVLERLEGHYIVGFGDRTGRSRMRLKPNVLEEVLLFLADFPEADEAASRAASWIEGFESPYGLELLASVHWAVRREGARDWPGLQETLKRWNTRKARFPEAHLRVALVYLLRRGALLEGEWEAGVPGLPRDVAPVP